jgi:hypothetical protein
VKARWKSREDRLSLDDAAKLLAGLKFSAKPGHADPAARTDLAATLPASATDVLPQPRVDRVMVRDRIV